ncbi:hypothetical protein LOTGIDRAFT_238004, partial [Lottia gigantea]
MLFIVLYSVVVVALTTAQNNSYINIVNDAAKQVSSHHATLHGHINTVFNNHPFYNTGTKTPSCPNPNDPSAVFELTSTPELEANYPLTLIANELATRSQLATVLASEIPAQSGLNLEIPVDEPFDTAETKCATKTSNVWTFTSAQNRGVCWVLQGFQDAVFAVNCVNPVCKGCDSQKSQLNSFTSWEQNFWASFNFPNFPKADSGFYQTQSTSYKNICVPRFEVRTIWAYCPLIADPLKIVREQIILPSACSCKKIRCQ